MVTYSIIKDPGYADVCTPSAQKRKVLGLHVLTCALRVRGLGQEGFKSGALGFRV